MKLMKTNHKYYSSESNYYVGNHNGENFGRYEADTWQEFKEDWFYGNGEIDHDYNHCFRFDILQKRNPETDEEIEGEFQLWLFFVLQRKGIYRPVLIKNVYEENMKEIESYLKDCWNYLRHQWSEVSQGLYSAESFKPFPKDE